MRNLSPDLIGAVDGEAAGGEGEVGAVGAADGSQAAIPVAGAAAPVRESDRVLGPLLPAERALSGGVGGEAPPFEAPPPFFKATPSPRPSPRPLP